MRRNLFSALALGAAILAPAAAAAAETTPVLPFIEDDYPRALSEARAKRLPIFVDAWAPW
jgi:hypothetical protein